MKTFREFVSAVVIGAALLVSSHAPASEVNVARKNDVMPTAVVGVVDEIVVYGKRSRLELDSSALRIDTRRQLDAVSMSLALALGEHAERVATAAIDPRG